jgi:Flp pilus assembly protein TadD
MKTFSFATLIFFFLGNLFGQKTSFGNEGTSRAVVIGISDYQDKKTLNLNYSDKDALTFAAYLKSKAGGNLSDQQIRLLINGEATAGNIYSAIYWLIETSNAGDKVLFYFSGYGDTNFGPKERPSFLLPYDAPYSVHIANYFPFERFKNVLNELATKKEVQLIMIVDSYVLQNVKNVIKSGLGQKQKDEILQNENEVMISSDNYSYSVKAINRSLTARTTYSYIMLDGLTGYADQNEDLVIDLQEIKDFVITEVKNINDKTSGLYLHINQLSTPFSVLDSQVVRLTKSHKRDLALPIVKIESNSVYKKIIEEADDSAQDQYQDFLVALRLGNLLTPNDHSANDYYKKLIQEPSLSRMKNGLRRMLAAAFQDEAQQAINSYLKMEPQELSNRLESSNKYLKYSKYLEKASELLGEKHYMASRLISMSSYFIGISQRLDADAKKGDQEAYEEALKIQEEALQYQDEAPFILNEIGLLNLRLNKFDEATQNFTKAMNLSPSWGIPYNNMGVVFMRLEDPVVAKGWFNNAIIVYPEFASPYYNMACIYAKVNKRQKGIRWLKKAMGRGFLVEEFIRNDEDLDNLRKMSRYKSLMKKYFPKSDYSY